MSPGVDPLDRSALRIYRRLLGYAFPYWRVFIFAALAMVVYSGSNTALVWLVEPLLDGSFVERDPDIIRIMPVAILGLFLVRGLGNFGSAYGMGYIGRQVIKHLRAHLFGHLMRLPTAFYDRHTTGQLLSRLTYNVEQVAQSTTDAVTVIIRDTVMVIGLLGLMFYLNFKLALFSLIVAPSIALLIRYVTRRFRKVSSRIQHSMGDVTQSSGEVIGANREIKIFGAEDHERRQFETINERNRRLNMKFLATKAGSTPAVQFIAGWAVAAIVFMATSDAMIEDMTPGIFAAFMGAMMGLLQPLRHLTTVNAQLQKGIAAAQSIFQLLDTAPEHDAGTRQLERARGDIRFENVSFTYDAATVPALRGVSVAIRPGQTVAFVGRSGSGKSTLVSLLPRFYDPRSGLIRLDGHDVREYRLSDLRSQIALVDQNVTLFNDTVAANIAYGSTGGVSRADIEEAARAANAWEFIETLEQGLDTLIGQNGVMLSGGQRQRLAIARALLKQAPILILDEATSALDTESERAIQGALERLMAERTTLVIAHRLSTIEKADLIVVMHDGQVVEQGQHEDLLAHGGHYAALHAVQFSDPNSGEDSPGDEAARAPE